MRTAQKGFSMIEMMIAIVLSLVVLAAAISLFQANRATGNTTTAVSAVSDNGRIAMDFISQSVRSAGYLDCNALNNMQLVSRNSNVLSAGATPIQHAYVKALGGFEAAGTNPGAATVAVAAAPIVADANPGDWNGAGLDAKLGGLVTKGSDVLLVRESVPGVAPVYLAAQYTGGAGVLNVQMASVAGLKVGQFAAISDCVFSTAFQIAAVGANAITANADLVSTYGLYAQVTPIDMYVYFVGPGRDNDSSLWQFDEAAGTFTEVVPDVENMQVLYGIASGTQGVAAQYVTADLVPDFNQVAAVKVALLLASPVGAVPAPAAAVNFNMLDTTVAPPLDSRLRKVFTSTISVRSFNQAGAGP